MSGTQHLAPAPVADPRNGRVLIQIEKEFEDEVRVGDATLILDPTYRPLHHVQEFGTVVAPPTTVPEWLESPVEVRPGDKVRFHFHSVCPMNQVDLQGQRYYLIPYEQLYYIERPDGSVQMLNEFCLVEPVLTAGGEEKTASGLITNLDAAARPRPVAGRAILRHAPPARAYYPSHAHPDDLIAYIKDADLPMQVGEHAYYLMGLREILVVL